MGKRVWIAQAEFPQTFYTSLNEISTVKRALHKISMIYSTFLEHRDGYLLGIKQKPQKFSFQRGHTHRFLPVNQKPNFLVFLLHAQNSALSPPWLG
jgi:hypothetical protein